MSEDKYIIPKHYRDIVQKYFTGFIATGGGFPLTSLGVKTAKVKRVLDSDLSTIIDGKRVDCLIELEDESLLHIEFQSKYSKKDIERFWHYDFLILNQYMKKVGNGNVFPKLKTIVIFTANVKPHQVDLSLDLGTHKYICEARFLSEFTDDESLNRVLNDITENPDLKLNAEDMITIVYGTLAFQYIEEINSKVYNVANIVNTLTDEASKATLLSTIYILTSKFLDKETLCKLEELMKMLGAFEEVEKSVREDQNLRIAKSLIGTLADELIIEKVGITREQLEELKKQK